MSKGEKQQNNGIMKMINMNFGFLISPRIKRNSLGSGESNSSNFPPSNQLYYSTKYWFGTRTWSLALKLSGVCKILAKIIQKTVMLEKCDWITCRLPAVNVWLKNILFDCHDHFTVCLKQLFTVILPTIQIIRMGSSAWDHA